MAQDKEFNLSEKIGYVDKNHVKVGTANANAVLLVKEVKEFIRLLKEEMTSFRGVHQKLVFIEKLNQLAGDKLI